MHFGVVWGKIGLRKIYDLILKMFRYELVFLYVNIIGRKVIFILYRNILIIEFNDKISKILDYLFSKPVYHNLVWR